MYIPACTWWYNSFQSIIEAAQQKDIQDMLNELEVMKSMQPHPHVVRLIGCCTEKGTGLNKLMNLALLFAGILFSSE